MSFDFITALYPDGLQGRYTYVWTLPDKASYWSGDIDALRAESLSHGTRDTYLGLGLAAKRGNSRTRTKRENVVAIPGFWYDIDCADDVAHKSKNLPARSEARVFIDGIADYGYAPTLVVDSGYGYHLYWLFEGGLWDISEPIEHARATAWAQYHSNALRDAMVARGWHADGTYDLSRVLRVPGTFNHKGKAPILVRMAETGGPRIPVPEGLPPTASREAAVPPKGGKPVSPIAPTLDGAMSPTTALVIDELRADPVFNKTWLRQRGTRGTGALTDQTDSGYEYSIINQCIGVGLDDATIANVVLAWRHAHRVRLDKPTERLADDIHKARTTSKFANTDALTNGDLSPDDTRSLLSGAFGYDVERIIRRSNDRDSSDMVYDPKARYIAKLRDGNKSMSLDLGTIAQLMEGRKSLQGAILAISKGAHYTKPTAREWEGYVRAIVAIAEDEDIGEDSREDKRVLGYLQAYLKENMVEDAAEGMRERLPFRKGEHVCIFASGFESYLRNTHRAQFPPHDLYSHLRSLGGHNTVEYVDGMQGRVYRFDVEGVR